jgi:Domain of unknown function (DUF4398)
MRVATNILVLAALAGLGCAGGTPPPNDQFAAAQADVGRAQVGGATDVPDARLHLQLATEDLQRARQLIDRDNAHAASLTAVASAEAQLALSLAQQATAREQARAVEDELQKNAGH